MTQIIKYECDCCGEGISGQRYGLNAIIKRHYGVDQPLSANKDFKDLCSVHCVLQAVQILINEINAKRP